MIAYIKTLWGRIVLPMIIDIITSAIIVTILYFIGAAIYATLLSNLGVSFNYIKVPTGILGLLYLFSIIIYSTWNHFLLLKGRISKFKINNTELTSKGDKLEGKITQLEDKGPNLINGGTDRTDDQSSPRG